MLILLLFLIKIFIVFWDNAKSQEIAEKSKKKCYYANNTFSIHQESYLFSAKDMDIFVTFWYQHRLFFVTFY